MFCNFLSADAKTALKAFSSRTYFFFIGIFFAHHIKTNHNTPNNLYSRWTKTTDDFFPGYEVSVLRFQRCIPQHRNRTVNQNKNVNWNCNFFHEIIAITNWCYCSTWCESTQPTPDMSIRITPCDKSLRPLSNFHRLCRISDLMLLLLIRSYTSLLL